MSGNYDLRPGLSGGADAWDDGLAGAILLADFFPQESGADEVTGTAAGTLDITGPLVLTDDAGTVVLADAAALSDDLRDGILQSARVVLERQLQIAAAEVQRVGGRHTVMSRAVASTATARPSSSWTSWLRTSTVRTVPSACTTRNWSTSLGRPLRTSPSTTPASSGWIARTNRNGSAYSSSGSTPSTGRIAGLM